MTQTKDCTQHTLNPTHNTTKTTISLQIYRARSSRLLCSHLLVGTHRLKNSPGPFYLLRRPTSKKLPASPGISWRRVRLRPDPCGVLIYKAMYVYIYIHINIYILIYTYMYVDIYNISATRAPCCCPYNPPEYCTGLS